MTLRLKGSTSGYSEIDAPAVAGDQVFTLPGTGGTLDRLNRAGNVLQVVSATKTDTASINSLTFADISGLSVSITPTAASNKILIIYNVTASWKISLAGLQIRIVRDSTALCIGDAAGSRPRISSTNYSPEYTGATVGADVGVGTQGNLFLDSPNSTSPLTYKLQFASTTTSGPVYVNRTVLDRDTAGYDARGASSLTVMEVAA